MRCVVNAGPGFTAILLLHLPTTGITGVHHHAQLAWCFLTDLFSKVWNTHSLFTAVRNIWLMTQEVEAGESEFEASMND